MAVEARHLNSFNPLFLANMDIMREQGNNNSTCSNLMDCGVLPLPIPAPEQNFSVGQSLICDPMFVKSTMNKSEDFTVSRKRLRDYDSTLDFASPMPSQKVNHTYADLDIASHMNQQQLEMDRLIAHHMQKMRMELEEKRQRQWKAVASAIQSAMLKKLWEKDEEIQRMGKLNWILQERVKSLYVENQIWRDLAQTNEATANSLRSNLEQVLAQMGQERHGGAEDAESCSSEGSSAPERKDEGQGKERKGWCRKCGEKQASVLVTPCSHLCLCTACGSSLLPACPVCGTMMNGSVHVDMSS